MGNYFSYVFCELKGAFNVEISPQNEAIIYDFVLCCIIDLLDGNWNKKTAEIVQTAVKKRIFGNSSIGYRSSILKS